MYITKVLQGLGISLLLVVIMLLAKTYTPWGYYEGYLDYSLFELFVWTFCVTHITIHMVTVYLHRTVTHRGVTLHPLVAHLFRFWNWLTTGMMVKEWVAIHRKHHAKVDTVDDPHTPIYYGLSSFSHVMKWVLAIGVLKYIKESHNQKTLDDFGHNTPDDWIERNVYSPHPYLGVGVLLGMVNVLLFGLPGLIIWGIQALWIPVLAAGVINGFGHFFGYQNWNKEETVPDGNIRYPNVAHSTNIMPIGILIGGEELHNNHHADPISPFFARKWWEFDLGSVTIRLLCLLRLAKLRTGFVGRNKVETLYYKLFNMSA